MSEPFWIQGTLTTFFEFGTPHLRTAVVLLQQVLLPSPVSVLCTSCKARLGKTGACVHSPASLGLSDKSTAGRSACFCHGSFQSDLSKTKAHRSFSLSASLQQTLPYFRLVRDNPNGGRKAHVCAAALSSLAVLKAQGALSPGHVGSTPRSFAAPQGTTEPQLRTTVLHCFSRQ